MAVTLITSHKGEYFSPLVEDEITWETKRKGSPGKLECTVRPDASLALYEGDAVRLSCDGSDVFYGYVFEKKRDKQGLLSVTAYDQLRYLKNKDTLAYEGLTASKLLQTIAGEFRLSCGDIEDTGYTLEGRVEDNQTLFDILQNALDETLQATGKLYVLYDRFGKLCLRDAGGWKLDILLDPGAIGDIDYTSGIDGQTFNKIKLLYDNQQTGKRELYIAQSGESMNEWGVLQYTETLQSTTGAREKADALLQLYNQKTKTLQVKGALGDVRVQAGCLVPVDLYLGDKDVQQYLLVESAKHTFQGQAQHTMDLTLIGGGFSA